MEQYLKRNGGYGIQVDLGDYFKPLGPGSDTVNQLMVESLNTLPLKVLNLATEDLLFWRQLSQTKLPATQVISTNLAPRDGSAPAKYAILEIPAEQIRTTRNLRIGFLGLSNPELVKPNSGFTGEDPMQAVAAVKPELMKKADFLVVLADLPKPVATRLAQAHPEIYAVLLIERTFTTHPAEQINNAVFLWSIERGRYLGQLVFELDDKGTVILVRPDAIELGPGITENPEFLRRQTQVAAKVPATGGH